MECSDGCLEVGDIYFYLQNVRRLLSRCGDEIVVAFQTLQRIFTVAILTNQILRCELYQEEEIDAISGTLQVINWRG